MQRLNRIFTTNFDPLLDKALDARGKRISAENAHEIASAQKAGLVPVIYLHGTLESKKYQITESDVFSTRFRDLHAVLRTALNQAEAFVFVGYSMSDPDFRGLYAAYREEIAQRMRQEKFTYVVSPAKDAAAYTLGKAVWEARGAKWLPMTAAEFFQRLIGVLASSTDQESRRKIKEKYSLGDDATLDDKIRRTAEILNVEEAAAVNFLLQARTKTGSRA